MKAPAQRVALLRTLGLMLAGLAMVFVFFAPPAARGQTSLIPTGAVWRYFDAGLDPGPLWKTNTFDDSFWPSGPAQLGFGDGDEATMVEGGPENARTPTIYFRRTFSHLGPLPLGLFLRLQRDDGAAVYLNGVEVYRNNLPAGTVNFGTFAVAASVGDDESRFYEAAVSRTLLRAGLNLIAVEVHQNTNTSSDLSFDFELVAVTNRATPSVAITNPPSNPPILPMGENFTIAATASAAGSVVTAVEFTVNGTLRYRDTNAPYEFVFADMPPGFHTVRAVATELAGGRATSAPVVFQAWQEPGTILVPNGATWRYFDGGLDQGNFWTSMFFDDQSWLLGAGELGYGDAGDNPPRPERTVVSGGPANNRFPTTYFRHTFHYDPTFPFAELQLNALFDDGIAVYINGIELYRDNLPAVGPVLYGMYALSNSPTDGSVYTRMSFPADWLQPGPNVIAAEVHQSSATSSDISFDLMLIGHPPSGPLPELLQQPGCFTAFLGTNVTFFVNALNAAAYQWLHNGVPIPGETNSSLTLSNLQLSHVGQYRAYISNPNGAILSAPGELQLQFNTEGTVQPWIIARDVLNPSGFGPAGGGPPGCSPPIQSMSFGQGYGFSTYNATRAPMETNHCGVMGGRSKWCDFESPFTRRVVVRTEGSNFDTVLAVYLWPPPRNENTPLALVACDNDSGPNGTSRVEFDAVAGVFYYIVVDGVNGATGEVRLQIGGLELSAPVELPDGRLRIQLTGERAERRTYTLRASTNLLAPPGQWPTVFSATIPSSVPSWTFSYLTNPPPAIRRRLFFNGTESP